MRVVLDYPWVTCDNPYWSLAKEGEQQSIFLILHLLILPFLCLSVDLLPLMLLFKVGDLDSLTIYTGSSFQVLSGQMACPSASKTPSGWSDS